MRSAVAAMLLAVSTRALHAEVPPDPAGVSSPMFESHAASIPNHGTSISCAAPGVSRLRILVSRCTATGWSEPTPPASAGDGVEATPTSPRARTSAPR